MTAREYADWVALLSGAVDRMSLEPSTVGGARALGSMNEAHMHTILGV